MDVQRRHLKISGRVQGVGFRQSTVEQAHRLGVAGWVRNLDNGGVEAVLEGPPDAVDALVAWCRSGPPWARVSRVAVTVEEPQGLQGFRTVR